MSASVPSGEHFVLDVDNVQDWSVGVSSMNRINTTLSQLWTWFYVLLVISGRMMDFSIGSSLKARNCGVRTVQRGGGSIYWAPDGSPPTCGQDAWSRQQLYLQKKRERPERNCWHTRALLPLRKSKWFVRCSCPSLNEGKLKRTRQRGGEVVFKSDVPAG